MPSSSIKRLRTEAVVSLRFLWLAVLAKILVSLLPCKNTARSTHPTILYISILYKTHIHEEREKIWTTVNTTE